MNSRVLLINPRITSAQHARFPLSIMSIAAALQHTAEVTLIDGNLDPSALDRAQQLARDESFVAVGLTVMGGPQIEPAIEISRAIRSVRANLPIVWGGYFPTLYPDAAINCDYVDYLIRGQGEASFLELLRCLQRKEPAGLRGIDGLSFRCDGAPVHNRDRQMSNHHIAPRLPYHLLPDPRAYAVQSFLGRRTVGHQAALGCRFRCTFCGVAAMFDGFTALPPVERLDRDLRFLREEIGADSVQYYDHNFFDRETDMLPLLDVLAKHALPWWCYARADALLNLSPSSWRLLRKSKLRMVYIGAETPNDEVLRSIRKGTRSEQTLEVAELCRRNGVIPELSFMVAPPQNAEHDTELTFDFIRRVKKVNPESEIIVYVHTPLPAGSVPHAERLNLAPLLDIDGNPVTFPTTPEGWAEHRWVEYACHMNAPWLSDRLRRRIRDFVTVLRCRFPTVQDTRSPVWARAALRGLATWRYATHRYDKPWELNAAHRLIGLVDPRVTSI